MKEFWCARSKSSDWNDEPKKSIKNNNGIYILPLFHAIQVEKGTFYKSY